MSDLKLRMYGELAPQQEPKPLNEWPLTGKLDLAPGLSIETLNRDGVRLKKGNTTLILPSSTQFKALETQVQSLTHEIKKLAADNRRLRQAHNGLVKAVNDLRNQLKSKVNKHGV